MSNFLGMVKKSRMVKAPKGAGEPGRFVTLKSGRVIFIPEGYKSKWAGVRERVIGAGVGRKRRRAELVDDMKAKGWRISSAGPDEVNSDSRSLGGGMRGRIRVTNEGAVGLVGKKGEALDQEVDTGGEVLSPNELKELWRERSKAAGERAVGKKTKEKGVIEQWETKETGLVSQIKGKTDIPPGLNDRIMAKTDGMGLTLFDMRDGTWHFAPDAGHHAGMQEGLAGKTGGYKHEMDAWLVGGVWDAKNRIMGLYDMSKELRGAWGVGDPLKGKRLGNLARAAFDKAMRSLPTVGGEKPRWVLLGRTEEGGLTTVGEAKPAP